jgi:hypothetical protein
MPALTALRNRAADVSPVKAPAMNITLGSAGVLSLAAVLTTWKDAFDFLFGADARDGIRAAILIATIGAIVLIASADMFARSIAARQDPWHVVPWAKGWTATIVRPGEDETGWLVAGMRVRSSSPEDVEYLLVKEGEANSWERAEVVRLKPPEPNAGG